MVWGFRVLGVFCVGVVVFRVLGFLFLMKLHRAARGFKDF